MLQLATAAFSRSEGVLPAFPLQRFQVSARRDIRLIHEFVLLVSSWPLLILEGTFASGCGGCEVSTGLDWGIEGEKSIDREVSARAHGRLPAIDHGMGNELGVCGIVEGWV